jgi:hypothetical protein
MSITVTANIKKLIDPFMGSTFIRPTGDDGLHLVGYDRHGFWQEFHSIEQAAGFANRERWADMEAKKVGSTRAIP